MGFLDRAKDWAAEGFGAGGSSGGRANGATAQAVPEGPIGPWHVLSTGDPWSDLHRSLGKAAGRRLFYGVYGTQFLFGPQDSHVLIMGPTRHGKTAGVLVPMVLCAGGPVVSTTTRRDVLRATAISRSRKGRVWHLNLDDGVAEPGTTQLRYSPITTNYKRAKNIAEALCFSMESANTKSNTDYFAGQAARLIGPTLLAAGLSGKSMEWVVDIVVSQNADLFTPVVDILMNYEDVPGVRNAKRELEGILAMSGSHGSANDIYATASRAFNVYNQPHMLELTSEPNFDPAAFVAGQPDRINPWMFTELDTQLRNANNEAIQAKLPRGWYDTIYITANRQNQASVAPVIVGLLQTLYDASAELREADHARGYYDRPLMTWALDEVASMSPWKDFPVVLSTAAGDGVLIGAVFHDMSQVREKWSDHTPGVMRTNMQTTVVFPGIGDQQTLRDLQETTGYHWVEVQSYGYQESSGTSGGPLTGTGQQSAGRTEQTSMQWLPILDEGLLKRGHPQDPSAILTLGTTMGDQGLAWAHASPYFQALPWPELLMGSTRYVDTHTAPDDARRLLPVPQLDRNGGQALYAAGRTPEQVNYLLGVLQWARAQRERRGASVGAEQ